MRGSTFGVYAWIALSDVWVTDITSDEDEFILFL